MRLWQRAAERAGAVDDVLRVGGADRLRDASCVSSRNIELLNGQSFFTNGLRRETSDRAVHIPYTVARSGVGRCANAMFLRADGRSVIFPS